MKNLSQEHLRKGGREKHIVPIMLVIFSLGFLFGTYKTFSIIYEDKYSDTAYHELREQLRENSPHQSTLIDLNDDDGAENEETENPATGNAVTAEYSAKRRQSMDFNNLQETYPEMRAWILAEGTGIDYPIMQTTDNEYYLSHLYDGTSNSNGSIFMDYRNTGMFTDDNTVIYGHHMKNGTMFNPLMEYKAQDFYEAHPTMMIYTEEGDYLVELICGTIENGDYEFVKFSFDDFDDMNGYVDELKKRSTFESSVNLLPGDKLVSMCTCTYERQNARYMLLGKITELYE